MALRDWSGIQVAAASLAWLILILVIGLPRILRGFAGRAADGHGGISGVTFGPGAMLLVLLLAIVPPVVLFVVWLSQRRR
jgi:hypothetical protein